MKRWLLFLLIAGLGVSCVPNKKLTYLQGSGAEESDSTFYPLQRQQYRVQPNDILNINVRTFDRETAEIFNIQGENANIARAGDLMFYLRGYSIDMNGYIDIPVIGEINVLGMPISEVKSLVQDRLNNYFQEGSTHVNVQLAGVRFSVVGEVARPGQYVLYQNQVNVFEALSSAGDITLVGNRQEVTIVRQHMEGVIAYQVDLTDASVLKDPKFFIQPNDIINVKPLPQRSLGIGTTGFQTFSSLVGVLASTITLIIALNNIQ